MFWIVENHKQLDLFLRLDYDAVFMEPILGNDNIHPSLNGVIALYIRGINAHKGYILPFNHSETTSIPKFPLNYNKIYVRNKKLCTYFFNTKNFKDLHFLGEFDEDNTTRAHQHLYVNYAVKRDINRIVPIVKHYEKCESLFEGVKHLFNKEETKPFNFFNMGATNCFYWVEKNGIGVNKDILKEKLELNEDIYSLNGQSIYSQYNLYTTTKRPSNSFNGVNYAALNKEDGTRKSFVPKNDELIEIDISAYHPTLIAKLINYKFKEEDIHQHFADLYGVDYKKSKELTFKQLYGGVFKQYENIEFFAKTKKFIEELHKKYNKDGFIEAPISGYKFEKSNLGEIGAQKLFNYLLQHLETANNVRILWEIIKIIRNAKTKLVLYTYDAFLFDKDNNEEDIMKSIINIFDINNLNIKISYGKNYDSLQRG